MHTTVKTIRNAPTDASIYDKALKLLTDGDTVAIPTETVYGLAANALNPAAIEKIFTAKGRPRDNPLIVHVSDIEMARGLGLEVHPLTERLAERFWQGPLTMILRRKIPLLGGTCRAACKQAASGGVVIPAEISCGLDTVAVRAPDSPVMQEIIRQCGFPLAAPSANASGAPSPTTAEHVYADLNGKIPLIIDGGECRHGLESTVVALDNNAIRILRPGAVTPEMLSEYAEVIVDDAVYVNSGGTPKSPGTAHRHYSPKAQVIAVVAESDKIFTNYADMNIRDGDYIIAAPQAQTLFAELREFDELGAERIYIRLPEPEGIGLALYNRIVRAAEFNIIRL
jgi:L-threonylcarbamoyladenylate synthase